VVRGPGSASQNYERLDPWAASRSFYHRVYFGGTMTAYKKFWKWVRTPIGRMQYLAWTVLSGLVAIIGAAILQTGLSSPDSFSDCFLFGPQSDLSLSLCQKD